MIKFRLVLILGVLVALASCGTTSDFVRSEGSVNGYSRTFDSGDWVYQDYLISRTTGFQTEHASVALQVAQSDTGLNVVSLVFQSYSHQDVLDNSAMLRIDGVPTVLVDVEPNRDTLVTYNDVVERNAVVLDESIVEALLASDEIVIDFIDAPIVVSGADLVNLQQFLADAI